MVELECLGTEMEERNVISFTLKEVPKNPDEPIEKVVEILEKALLEAREGKIRGVAFVFLKDKQETTGWECESGRFNDLATGILCLQYRLSKAAYGDPE